MISIAGPSAYLTTPWCFVSTPFQYRVWGCTRVSANRGSVRDFVQVIVQVGFKRVYVLYQAIRVNLAGIWFHNFGPKTAKEEKFDPCIWLKLSVEFWDIGDKSAQSHARPNMEPEIAISPRWSKMGIKLFALSFWSTSCNIYTWVYMENCRAGRGSPPPPMALIQNW